MTISARRKLLVGVGSFVGLTIVALLALPFVIDPNAYKPEIVAQAKQATGRDLVVDGPISLSILPLPTVRLDGVRLSNVAGAKTPDMVEAKAITVRPSLLALLAGRLEAGQVTLIEPKIALQIDDKGKPNWVFAPSTGGDQSVPVNDFAIENGIITFDDARSGLSTSARAVSFAASAGSMEGPFAVTGRATVDDAALTLDLSVGAKGASGHDADGTLDVAGGRLAFRGILSGMAPDARFSGKASASADNLVLFVETLAKLAGQPRPHLPPLLAGKFRFEGPIELSRKSVASKDFTLALGDDTGTGSLAATAEPLDIEARFAAPRIDLDRWLKSVVLQSGLDDETLPEFALSTGSRPAPSPQAATSWLSSVSARLALEVGEIIYNGQAVRGVALALDARDGVVAIPKFTATLPGDLVVKAESTRSGQSPRSGVSGEFRLEGKKLRETLTWLDVDLSAVPADKLTHVSMHGTMNSRNGNVQVDNLAVELDDIKGKGDIAVAFTVPLSIVMQLALDVVDLDSYVAPGDRSPSATSPTEAVVPLLALLGPSLGLKLKVAKIDYRSDVIAGVETDISRQGGTLRLNDLKVASLAGARLEVRGAIAKYWTAQPRANVVFAFDSPDIDRVFRLAAAPPTGLGAFSARGGAAGTWESLAIRDVTASALGSTIAATGTLSLRGVPQRKVQSVSYKGHLVVNSQPLDASIDAELTERPFISAELKADSFDFGRIAQGRATSRQQVAAAQALAFDTASLRSFDGKFSLVAGSVGGAKGLGNADIAAELKDGKLAITHLKGGLHGGTLNLSGMIDATQPVLTFDLRGDVTGMRVGELMREMSGSNEVGSLIKITLDGVLNATNIALRGSGSTIGELRASLAGSARAGGHIHPRADRFLQFIGAAATGVTGGVIDATLGNLVSLFGDKSGVGIGNILNAISLVLNRFVNNDNPLSGDVEIANGLLVDRHLVLQGRGATAAISTRTNIGNATTDTTVTFTLAEEPSAPYLIMTVRGPLAAPAFSASRGSAKDPPGMVNILSTIEKIPSLLPKISIPTPHIPNPFSR